MKRFVWYQLPLILACTAVFIVSSLPTVPPIPLPFLADKIPHAIAYGILAILAYRAFLHQEVLHQLRSSPVYSAIVFAIVYGGTDEIHQLYVPGRHGDILDLVADAVGAVLFTIAFAWIVRRRHGSADAW